MRIAHFHAHGRNGPYGIVEVELVPAGLHDLVLAYEREQHKENAKLCCRGSRISVKALNELENIVLAQRCMTDLSGNVRPTLKDSSRIGLTFSFRRA